MATPDWVQAYLQKTFGSPQTWLNDPSLLSSDSGSGQYGIPNTDNPTGYPAWSGKDTSGLSIPDDNNYFGSSDRNFQSGDWLQQALDQIKKLGPLSSPFSGPLINTDSDLPMFGSVDQNKLLQQNGQIDQPVDNSNPYASDDTPSGDGSLNAARPRKQTGISGGVDLNQNGGRIMKDSSDGDAGYDPENDPNSSYNQLLQKVLQGNLSQLWQDPSVNQALQSWLPQQMRNRAQGGQVNQNSTGSEDDFNLEDMLRNIYNSANDKTLDLTSLFGPPSEEYDDPSSDTAMKYGNLKPQDIMGILNNLWGRQKAPLGDDSGNFPYN